MQQMRAQDTAVEWPKRLFLMSVIHRQTLRQIGDLMGPIEGRTCLLVNGERAGLALNLCAQPGTWYGVHTSKDVCNLLKQNAGQRAYHMVGSGLGFDDEFFDVVVVHDFLEYVEDPQRFIAQCHRVLKPEGRLIIHVPHAKRWPIARALQRIIGLRTPTKAHASLTYSGTDVFDIVKDGFDVHDERTYSRFFLEVAESIVEMVGAYAVGGIRKRKVGEEPDEGEMMMRLHRVRSWSYPLLVAANMMDVLLFFSSGYHFVCRARRRIWRARRAPVLQDGRSIADATINTKIGTAGPF